MTGSRSGSLPGLATHLVPVGVHQMDFSVRRLAPPYWLLT